jgi:hypothetical protein
MDIQEELLLVSCAVGLIRGRTCKAHQGTSCSGAVAKSSSHYGDSHVAVVVSAAFAALST